MTFDEFDTLEDDIQIVPMVNANDLVDRSDRTLLWGYDVDRCSWHVFLRDGLIELYVYRRGDWGDGHPAVSDHMVDREWPVSQLVPNKRLYPEACDAEFCRLILRTGTDLPFTTFNAEREPRQFHGEVPDKTW